MNCKEATDLLRALLFPSKDSLGAIQLPCHARHYLANNTDPRKLQYTRVHEPVVESSPHR